MSRQDQYNVTVTIGDKDLGTFDKMTGGEIDSEETKYRPGAMGAPITLGGYVNTNNVTVSRLFKLDRDIVLVPFLRDQVGKGDAVVTKQSLDVNGNPFGTPLVYKGKLKQFTPPEVDSESSDAALFELEISSATTV